MVKMTLNQGDKLFYSVLWIRELFGAKIMGGLCLNIAKSKNIKWKGFFYLVYYLDHITIIRYLSDLEQKAENSQTAF